MITLNYIAGFRSGVINDLIDCVRMQRIIPGPGLLVSEGPGGTALTLARGSADAGPAPRPWHITFNGLYATCSDCVYMRGPVTIAATVAPLTLSLDDAYIAAHINLADGTAILAEGASIAAVTDAAPLDDDTLAKVLLYRVFKITDTYAVTMDYRNAPQLGVRL